MQHTTSGSLFLSLMLDHSSSTPLYQQLYEQLRSAILSGELPGGVRLPSTRSFANTLGLSRSTVLIAFEQLLYEGYIRGKVGSGTYVESVLPDELLQSRFSARPAQPTPDAASRSSQPGRTTATPQTSTALTPHPQLSRRGAQIASTSVAPITDWDNIKLLQAFRPGIPALSEFPFKLWSQLVARRARATSPELLGYSNPAGFFPLRREIAAYAQAARGVHCSPEQVLIVAGSQQALNLATQLLIDAGDPIWIEDPCYLGARGAFLSNGAQLIPVPVDQEGLRVSDGIARCPTARLVYVTPSHQFPLGTTMSLARRLALLQWASQAGSWILEDDYDGEYRYAGRPLASLQGLDTTDRVIYIGTFSKVLFPGLRLGYLIVPPSLVAAFTAARAAADRHPHMLDQLVLTDFITGEHFARHVRRMRSLYAERQSMLLSSARSELGDRLSLSHSQSGMHLVGYLPEHAPDLDTRLSHLASQLDVAAPPLSRYYLDQPSYQGLVLGYTSIDEPEIRRGVQALAHIL